MGSYPLGVLRSEYPRRASAGSRRVLRGVGSRPRSTCSSSARASLHPHNQTHDRRSTFGLLSPRRSALFHWCESFCRVPSRFLPRVEPIPAVLTRLAFFSFLEVRSSRSGPVSLPLSGHKSLSTPVFLYLSPPAPHYTLPPPSSNARIAMALARATVDIGQLVLNQ